MKDKSRFISSVIVSLLAGFIYYQFGEDIKQDIQISFKAVLSSNDTEIYFPLEPQPFDCTIKKSGSKSNKKKSKFYLKKKNTIEIKTKGTVVPGDELLSNFIIQNQARIQKATPDKNIDFTAELQNLASSDLNKSKQRQSKEIKGNKSVSNSNLEASLNNSSKSKESNKIHFNFEESQRKYKQKYSVGKGFEYNYVIEENSSVTPKKVNKKGSYNKSTNYEGMNSELKEIKVEVKTNVKNGKKLKVITPKVYNKSGDKVKEVIMPDSNCDGDSM